MTTAAVIAVEQDPRWARIIARDRAADGAFWYSVATTGIYCRPSCPSRTARAENVSIHATLAEARATGFRPCRRCRPDDPSIETVRTALVARACRTIEGSEQAPSLAALAKGTGLSPGRFHRLFRAVTGLTPRAWAAADRAARMRTALEGGGGVTRALHDAGYGSSSRFYESATARLGMTPRRYRSGGAGEVLRFAVGACSLGAILVASSEKGIAAILLGDEPQSLIDQLGVRFANARLIGADAGYETLVARVVGLVEAPGIGHDLPLDLRGTAFQQRVWQALTAIPAGETLSYAELARRIGAPRSTRAVAAACGANAHAIAIPCHRVVRTGGALAGYRWGVARKQALLDREAGR